MSASEDSEVDEGLDSSSSFTSSQPAQGQTLGPTADQSSDPGQSVHEPGFLPDIDNTRGSDECLLPPDGGHQDLNTSTDPLLNQGDLAEPVDLSAAEESYYIRANRHYGPASTWQSWTKDDRDVAESLEVERAQNLSIHLYNAHALRLQAQQLRETSSRKRRRGTSDTDDDEMDAFGVPKVWASWPMPPDEVPRSDMTGRLFDKRPSKELEESLISLTTKAGRERWNTRDWRKEEQIKQQASAEQRDQRTGPTAFPDENVPVVQPFRPQAFSDDDSSPKKSDDASDNDFYGVDQTARPAPLADEGKARTLLLPSTRHAISKLDHLLMSLHCARQSYALPMPRDDDDTITSPATDDEPQSSRSSRKRRRRSSAQRASSISSADTEGSLHSSMSGRKKGVWKDGSRRRNRKSNGLGLRDWSDVLGMAAVTGWNDDIVARASKRCAELFGENMLFRRFHEAAHQEGKSFFTERLASGEEPRDIKEAYLGRRSWVQGTDEDAVSDMEVEPGLRHPCPIESCPRNTMPFHTEGNLKQHMTSNHTRFAEDDDKDGIIEAAVRDGRQVFCPVPICRRSSEPFTKGSKLYLHVRKMHPDVNVEDLKKLESQRRVETRGKWAGERRRKNPYERS